MPKVTSWTKSGLLTFHSSAFTNRSLSVFEGRGQKEPGNLCLSGTYIAWPCAQHFPPLVCVCAHAGAHTRWAVWGPQKPSLACVPITLRSRPPGPGGSHHCSSWAGHIFILIGWPCFPWATDEELLCSSRMVASV